MKTVIASYEYGKIVFIYDEESQKIKARYKDSPEERYICYDGLFTGDHVISLPNYFYTTCRNWWHSRLKHYRLKKYTIRHNSPNQYVFD